MPCHIKGTIYLDVEPWKLRQLLPLAPADVQYGFMNTRNNR